MTAFAVHATAGTIRIHATADTYDTACKIAAEFPKVAGVRAGTLTRPVDGDYGNGAELVGWVGMDIMLSANQVNRGRNETGIRRYRAFRRHAERLGHTVTWEAPFSNSYPTEAAFEVALNA